MASLEFYTLPLTDAQCMSAFEAIVSSTSQHLLVETLIWKVLDQGGQDVETPFAVVHSTPDLKALLEMNSSALRRMQVNLKILEHGGRASITLHRSDGGDKIRLELPDQHVSVNTQSQVAASVRVVFAQYDRTRILEQVHPLLADFYQRREATLLRLEELQTKILHEATAHRYELERSIEEERKRIQQQLSDHQTELDARYNSKIEELIRKQGLLEKREAELDDRGNTHARRKLREDLKSALKERSAQFSLSPGMRMKRAPIHVAFCMLLVALASLAAYLGYHASIQTTPDITTAVVLITRFGVSVTALIAAFVFYIRWMDRWAQTHTDEEFRLKRLDLDIDRASWLVEMMLEWQEEKKAEIPKDLIGALARGLFEIDSVGRPTLHPSEDLLAALLSASANLRVAVPGIGEATLDRKSIRELEKKGSG